MELSIEDIKVLHALLKYALEGDDSLSIRLRKDELARANDLYSDMEYELESQAVEAEEEDLDEYDDDHDDDDDQDGEIGDIEW